MTKPQKEPQLRQAVTTLMNLDFSVLPVNGYDHPEKPKAQILSSWR
ncbi:hypothetical protein [Desulfosediminicola ganghwensis]|nr:hypothetical protein [Desulfosediminicola ganghwensis]